MKHLLLTVVFYAMTCCATADTVDLYLLTGQSNSTNSVKAGLESVLGAEVLHGRHSGHPLESWYDTFGGFPRVNYNSDFFVSNFPSIGSGLLESRIAEIEAAGDVARLRGLFWFQGEADTFAAQDAADYSNRFNFMLSNLAIDLGYSDFEVIVAVIDGNLAQAGSQDPIYLEDIRLAQMSLGTAQLDSRGYARQDLWHLTGPEATRFGQDLGQLYLSQPVPILSAWMLLAVPLVGIAMSKKAA